MTLVEYILACLWQLVALLVLLACSAFFSGSETALFSLSPAQLMRFRQGGGRVGRTINHLLHHPRRLLMVILLGNQLVNVAFFAVATGLIVGLDRVEAAAAYRGLMAPIPLLLIILLGEVCPKNLAISAPAAFARTVAVPLAILVKLLGPVQEAISAGLIEPLTRLFAPSRQESPVLKQRELSELLAVAGRHAMIPPDESAWLQEVLRLGGRKISEIMVPRVDIVAYDADAPPAGLVALFRRTRLVKIPVYRDDLDHTLGVVYAKELLLNPAGSLAEMAKPVPFVPESGSVDKLLQQFRRMRSQMAIVVDEYGGTAGLVTLEDALEEIVGEIATEGEPVAEPVRQVGPDEYLIDGNLAVHDWADVFGVDLRAERISTIGGLVMSLLDRVPAAGDVARTGNLEFTVESVRGRRIRSLRLRVLGEDQP